MSNKPSDFEEWLKQHVSEADFKRIQETSQQVEIEVKAAVPQAHKHPKKYKEIVAEEDYEDLFKGILEPRVIMTPGPNNHAAANHSSEDVESGGQYEPVSEEELANALLQKAAKLGWEDVAQKVIEEHNYDLLVGFADMVNKTLVSHGTSSRSLVKTHKKAEQPIIERPTRLRLNWARKLLKHDYGYLYDRLVEEGYLEDTGKEIFLYYFTGQGDAPTGKLVWTADSTTFAVLIDYLSKSPTKRPWSLMSVAFPDLECGSMSVMLSRAKKNQEQYGGLSYRQHTDIILRLLQ